MKNKKVPIRQCIGCRERKAKQELLRIVHTPEGEILLDLTGKRNGRGMYLCKNAECLLKAEKKKALQQAFGTSISVEIYKKLEKELALFDSE